MQEIHCSHLFDARRTFDDSEQCCQSLASFVQKAHQCHLTSAPRGAASVRLSAEGSFCITPLALSFEDITEVDAYLINHNSNCIQGAACSSIPLETRFHFKAYKTRPDINAIAHLYPIYTSAYTVQDGWVDLINGSIKTSKRILKVDCEACISRFCGLCACKDDSNRYYSGNDVLFLKEDGIVILGQNLEEILEMSEIIERFSRSYFIKNFRKTL